MIQIVMMKMPSRGMWAYTVASLMVCVTMMVMWASPARAAFGIEKFENLIAMNIEGSPAIQAGSHPYSMTTTVVFNHHEVEEAEILPDGDPKDIYVNLPRGMIVNPIATGTKCTEAELENEGGCPNAAAVGIATIYPGGLGINAIEHAAVYDIVPPPGVPAELGFDAVAAAGVIVHVVGRVRTGGDYGLSAEVSDISQKAGIYATTFTLWGNPADPSHNSSRGFCATRRGEEFVEEGGSCPFEGTGRWLLTLPSSCTGEALTTTMLADSWQEPGTADMDGTPDLSNPHWRTASSLSPAVTDCEGLDFSPSLTVRPDAEAAESPSGLSVDLHVPQEESPSGLAEANLKEAVVRLPPGVAVSPSAAGGLEACTPEEIGLTNTLAPSCPDASKIGSVEVTTPLLERALEGSVYLAQQGNAGPAQGSNPFQSLIALYLVAEGSGALIKLPGEVSLDKATGQVTAHFGKDPLTGQFLPELPFSELKMNFFGGPRASLVTPSGCSTYHTESQLLPYSSKIPAEPSSSFTISSGCSGGFAPSFVAGTTNNQAAAYSPLSVTLSRKDGEGRLAGVQIKTPPGLLGVLKSVVQCPEPQASLGTCGPESLIGHTTVAAGPGADPIWLGGSVYLTGPYKGAPFGLSIVVPAVAGPFNLGNEIVRARIAVDPHTAQLTVTSDPLPTILQGVPLDLRTVSVSIDRPGFILNPTDCTPLTVAGTIGSTMGASAGVSSPFQAANCGLLPFTPKFTVLTQGRTSKVSGASLHVKVVSGAGQANIAKTVVSLPKRLPSRLTTLQKACLAAVFEANPASCPAASLVGSATAASPLLAHQLAGPAYLVSHGGAAFPDLVIVLQGEGVTVDLAGKTEIKKGITSSLFETVPDVPVSAFDLILPQGPHSLLTANGNLCSSALHMPTTITGHNGAVVKQTTKIAVSGCLRHKAKKKKGLR
jgi:hypothetical protein